MNNKQLLRMLCVLGVSWSAAGGAAAQDPEAISAPCTEEIKALCASVESGGGRIGKCLKEHAAELGPACRERIATGKEAYGKFATACRGDAKQFCGDVVPGEGRVLHCLRENAGKLSSACTAALPPPVKQAP